MHYRELWPTSKIFLCFWHVKKAWAENAATKIIRIEDRANLLKEVGDVLYGKRYVVGTDPVAWANKELDKIRDRRPSAAKFMKYIDKHWRKKIGMWCAANRNVPHAGQNTNAGIESFHANLKRILLLEKQRFVGRRMDWLADDLKNKVTGHYWYARALKEFGFVRNIKQEFLIASAILLAHEIPDSYVYLNPEGDDIALVVSINNYPKIWTVYGTDTEWAQCDCFVGQQNTMCKHVMKVFMMKHPAIDEGLIIREAGTRCGMERTIPMADAFGSTKQDSDGEDEVNFVSDFYPPGGSTASTSCTAESNKKLILGTNSNPIVLSDNNEPFKSQSEERQFKTCGTEWNPIIIESTLPSQNRSKQDDPAELIRDILSTAGKHSELQNHLVADLKNIRGRYRKMIARGIACKDVKETTPTFPLREGDWSLKRKLGRLEAPRASKRCRA